MGIGKNCCTDLSYVHSPDKIARSIIELRYARPPRLVLDCRPLYMFTVFYMSVHYDSNCVPRRLFELHNFFTYCCCQVFSQPFCVTIFTVTCKCSQQASKLATMKFWCLFEMAYRILYRVHNTCNTAISDHLVKYLFLANRSIDRSADHSSKLISCRGISFRFSNDLWNAACHDKYLHNKLCQSITD